MKKVIYDRSREVTLWADKIIGGADHFPENATAIGLEEDGELIAACVYTGYTYTSVLMHIASNKQGWMNREFLYACFNYPFNHLKCRRVSGLVRVDNPKTLAFDLHLGFKLEGVLREGEEDGCDLYMLGMLRSECRWLKLKEKVNGKKVK